MFLSFEGKCQANDNVCISKDGFAYSNTASSDIETVNRIHMLMHVFYCFSTAKKINSDLLQYIVIDISVCSITVYVIIITQDGNFSHF